MNGALQARFLVLWRSTISIRKTGLVAVLGVWCSITVAGCGGAEANRDSDRDENSQVRISGATPEQEATVREILDGLGDSDIATVEVGIPPGCPASCPDPTKSDSTWLRILVRVESEASSIKPMWHALLLAGAFRTRSHQLGLPPTSGMSILVEYADGRVEDGGSFAIDESPADQVVERSTAELSDRIRSDVSRGAADIASLTFVRPLKLAPVVVVVASDPKAFLESDSLRQVGSDLIHESSPLAEGRYVELRDNDGTVIAITAYAVRTGTGIGWYARGYEPDSGGHWGGS